MQATVLARPRAVARLALEQVRLLALQARALRRPPLLVYQMGKVGSASVAAAVKAAAPDRLVLHLHTLDPERLDEDARLAAALRRAPPNYVTAGRLVRRLLRGWPPRPRPWRIITLVRDPMARNVSTFFQTLDYHWAATGFAARLRGGEVEGVVEEMIDCFMDRFPHHRAVGWFSEEIEKYFAVDLLSARPRDGAALVEGRGVRVLLLRLEDLGRTGESSLADFLGVEGVSLSRRNVSEEKYYSAAHGEFLDRFVAPQSLLDELYDAPAIRAFYSPDEIARFRARWSRGSAETAG